MDEIREFIRNIDPMVMVGLIIVACAIFLLMLAWMGKNDDNRRNEELAHLCEVEDEPVDEDGNKADELESRYRNLLEEFNTYRQENTQQPSNKAMAVICMDCGWKGTIDETLFSYGHTCCPYCRKEFKELWKGSI